MVSASGVQRLFVYFVAHSEVVSEMGHKFGDNILGDETSVRSDTLSIECQGAYASYIVTDDDSTSKDAVSKSMLRLGHNPGMCDEAFGEAPGTAG